MVLGRGHPRSPAVLARGQCTHREPTTGTVSVTDTVNGTAFRAGFVHGPSSGTDGVGAAQASGVVQLVTPIALVSSLGPNTIAGFGTLTLHFVPEPGQALLLITGAALLALLGWRRKARR